MKNILVTGSLAFDYIMDFPGTFEENILPHKLKTLSVSFNIKNLNKNFGGVSGNIAYNLALLKQPSFILASVGKSDFKTYSNHLKKTGVNTEFIKQIKNEFTANAFIITDKNNCQITSFYSGALLNDSILNIKEVKKDRNIDLLIIGATIPTAMNNFINQAKNLKIPYLYHPAQQITHVSKDYLIDGILNCEIFISNDYELALVLEKTKLTKNEILKKVKILITTLGEKGSLIETNGKKIEVNSVKSKKVIDPTGAGDAYISGFIAGYIKEYPLKTCGQIGATLATYAIENYGTQNHKFTIEHYKKRYVQAFGENINI